MARVFHECGYRSRPTPNFRRTYIPRGCSPSLLRISVVAATLSGQKLSETTRDRNKTDGYVRQRLRAASPRAAADRSLPNTGLELSS